MCFLFSLQLSILKVNNIETLPQSAQNGFTLTRTQNTASHTSEAPFFQTKPTGGYGFTPHSPQSHQTLHEVKNTSAFCGELPQPSLGGTSPGFQKLMSTPPQTNRSKLGFSGKFPEGKGMHTKHTHLAHGTNVSGGRFFWFFDTPNAEHAT